VVTSLAMVVLAGSIALAGPPQTAPESPTPSDNVLHVHLIGLRNSNGQVHCTIFDSPRAFPDDDKGALRDIDGPVKDDSGWCNFKDLTPGTFAMVVYHDENGNGKFDENILGMPEEGYAFSNNFRPTFSAPKFSDCAFDYKGGEQWLTITMIY